MLAETLLLLACEAGGPAAATITRDFDAAEDLAACAVAAAGEPARRMPEPKIQDGRLSLPESWWKSSASVARPAPAEAPAAPVEVAWTLIMELGIEPIPDKCVNDDRGQTWAPARRTEARLVPCRCPPSPARRSPSRQPP